MATTIFVSLPVQDPKKSTAFYEALGYKRNAEMGDESTGCIMISDTIAVMFTTKEMFEKISPKPMSDPKQFCQALLSLTCDSKEEVDALVKKAIAAGGTQAHDPEDYGFMYQWGFYDPDGHGWGLTAMTPNKAE